MSDDPRREQIARAIAARRHPNVEWPGHMGWMEVTYLADADAVLAVLNQPTTNAERDDSSVPDGTANRDPRREQIEGALDAHGFPDDLVDHLARLEADYLNTFGEPGAKHPCPPSIHTGDDCSSCEGTGYWTEGEPPSWDDENENVKAMHREDVTRVLDAALAYRVNGRPVLAVLDQPTTEPPADTFQHARELLGQQVRVTLAHNDPQAVAEGRLLKVADSGDVAIEDEMGFVHYCWPMLSIRRVPAPTEGADDE